MILIVKHVNDFSGLYKNELHNLIRKYFVHLVSLTPLLLDYTYNVNNVMMLAFQPTISSRLNII